MSNAGSKVWVFDSIATGHDRLRRAAELARRFMREDGMTVDEARTLIETKWGLPPGSIKRWRPGK